MVRKDTVHWIGALLLCSGLAQATNDDGIVYLERGQRGSLPCPLVECCQVSEDEVLAIYWYYGSKSDSSLLISYFLGRVAPQNGIPEGVYDIDEHFGLVIENVTASNEGTYYYSVKTNLKMLIWGYVKVRDKVSPSRPYPTVIGCNQDYDTDTCEVRVPHDSTVHNLTCVMEQVKPAVELRWIHLFLGGQKELNASTTVKPAVLPGSSLRNNTYSTSASIQIAAVDDEEVYECEAVGVAVGGRPARTRVRLTKTYPTTTTYDTTTDGTTARNRVQTPKCQDTQPRTCKREKALVAELKGFRVGLSISVVANILMIAYIFVRNMFQKEPMTMAHLLGDVLKIYSRVPTKAPADPVDGPSGSGTSAVQQVKLSP